QARGRQFEQAGRRIPPTRVSKTLATEKAKLALIEMARVRTRATGAGAHTASVRRHTRGGSRMRESRTYGSGRGGRDETHVPNATLRPCILRRILLHLLASGCGTTPTPRNVRYH